MTRPRRELCVYAGPPHAGARSEPGRGVPRTCGHPNRGGTVQALVECRSCPLHRSRPAAPAPAPAPVDRAPCAHEGPVSESCPSCAGAPAELRHVRFCLHPDEHAPDKCTRGPNTSGGAVASCADCPIYRGEIAD